MSLKSFHIFFITLAVLLSVGCSMWGFLLGNSPIFAAACAVVALGLVVYGILFVKKARGIIT